MTIPEMKARQRAEGIAARQAVDAAARDAMNREIARRIMELPAFDSAQVIFSYCAVRGEADPALIESAARDLGKQVAYPVCCGNGRMFAAVPDAPDAMQRGLYGILTPVPGHYRIVSPERIDLALVPCTVFDSRCLRIGMGSGYYDRYLRLCTGAFSVALAFEVQKVFFCAAEEHDRFLDAVATEGQMYRGAR